MGKKTMAAPPVIIPEDEREDPFEGVDMDTIKPAKMTSHQKAFVVEFYNNSAQKPADRENIVQLYHVSQPTLYRWVDLVAKSHRDPAESFEFPGRPKLMDDIGEAEVKAHLISEIKAGNSATKTMMRNIIQKCSMDTLRRSNKAPVEVLLSDNTLRYYRTKMKISESKAARCGTEARRRNMRDIRNFFVAACMHAFWMLNLYCGHLLNLDATQYSVGRDGTVEKTYYIADGSEDSERQRGEVDADSNGTYVKVFNCISDLGYAATQIYIIACEDMEPDACIVIRLLGLSFSTSPTDFTILVFCKTRSGNAEVWALIVKWVSDFAVDIHAATGSDSQIVLKMDGENAQLVNFCTDSAIALLEQAQVIIYKGCASLSQVENELDAGNVHRGSKTKNRHMADNEWLFGHDEIIQRVILSISSSPVAEYACADLAWITSTAHAIVRVAKSNEGVLTKSTILKSYQKAKSSPPNGTLRKDWDLLTAKLGMCLATPKHSLAEYDTMVAAFESCTALCSKGFLTEAEMDEHSIPISDIMEGTGIDKDQRAMSSKRGTLLSEEQVLAEFRTSILDRQNTNLAKELKANRKAWIKTQLAHLGNDVDARDKFLERIEAENKTIALELKLRKSGLNHKDTTLSNWEAKMKEYITSYNDNADELDDAKLAAEIYKHRKWLAKKHEGAFKTISGKFKTYRTKSSADTIVVEKLKFTEDEENLLKNAEAEQVVVERNFWLRMVEEFEVHFPEPPPPPANVVVINPVPQLRPVPVVDAAVPEVRAARVQQQRPDPVVVPVVAVLNIPPSTSRKAKQPRNNQSAVPEEYGPKFKVRVRLLKE